LKKLEGEIAQGKIPEIVFDKMKKSGASPTVNFFSGMMFELPLFRSVINQYWQLPTS